MGDRDSLSELYEIVSEFARKMELPLTREALPFVASYFGQGCDLYFRRRLANCRIMVDMHLPIEASQMDVLLMSVLSHSLPGAVVPEGYIDAMLKRCEQEPRIGEVLSVLRDSAYYNQAYYSRLVQNKYALMIRLAERSVLVEKLYEWPISDALKYIRDTRENFFPMCIYVKDHYREFTGGATILMEKMRNLIAANEVLLHRYDEMEKALKEEILGLKEDSSAVRSMILELKNSAEE